MFIYNKFLFSNPIAKIYAFNNIEFIDALKKIEKYRKNYYLLGYIRYEVKNIFLNKNINSKLPLLYFVIFKDYKLFKPEIKNTFALKILPTITFDEYSKNIKKIKYEISEGNTYEVNYTFDFDIEFDGDEFALYQYLLQKQNTPYTTFIENKFDTLLSFSPELFFSIENNHIITKPMKGTIKRGKNKIEDAKNIDFLKKDIKNRAENIMIVDLLRNDLGRIAKPGSIKTTRLFDIETHPTLHQMTSQIEADLENDISLFKIFEALFPCGSITGAPKISTMNIIDTIEKGTRNIYCGAIGFITPKRYEFSVPIRILQKSIFDKSFKYRAGGAIVQDSTAQNEWLEVKTKTKFLNSDFKIIETMKIENGEVLFLEEHLKRMKNSAKHFKFIFDKEKIKIDTTNDIIVRILLDAKGNVSIEYRSIENMSTNKVRVSPITVDNCEEFLYHKTTYRPYYDVNYDKYYDELFFNGRGDLTEGSRTNILLAIDNHLYTPPVECGLLNGILRQHLLNSGQCKEKILRKDDLNKAGHIYCINSVRGIKKVELA
ncbi:MAG: aminodeoxychorismate synthase component I [Lactobacillales bacterium]|jgi:para-aminobenzoate synthetase/4-amino-4-deoxychorismate lyase|nr:aminodeoxychorismate synthase component I [Lactobacillales bacterium]